MPTCFNHPRAVYSVVWYLNGGLNKFWFIFYMWDLTNIRPHHLIVDVLRKNVIFINKNVRDGRWSSIFLFSLFMNLDKAKVAILKL